jgi:hypothetical protein
VRGRGRFRMLATAFLACALGAGCGAARSSARSSLGSTPATALAATAGGSPCAPPAVSTTPGWIPSDLPFPAGSYVVKDLGLRGAVRQAEVVIPVTQTALAGFLQRRWPAAGYRLTDGDAEPGKEIDQEARGPSAEVALKAEVVACDPGFQDAFLSVKADDT